MVNQVWGKHATVAEGTDDSGKQISVNVWNESLNRKGLLGFDAETVVGASEITIPDDTSGESSDGTTSSFIKLSGSTSVDKFINTNTNDGDLLYLITTGSVTLNNVSSPSVAGQIRLLGDAAKDLSTTVPTILMRVGDYWYEYGVSGVILTPSIITSSLTTVGTIGTGTWQGTAVADGYLGTGINANKIADASVSSTEFQHLDGVTSDIQGQIDAKQASLTFGIADTNKVQIDGSGTATGEYAKFTATGIIGEEVADVKTDLSLNNVENTALSTWAGTTNITTVGALSTGGSITSDFGTINNGSSTITTTGALASGAITTSGTLTMGDNIITGIKSLDTDIDDLAWNASTVIDFDTNEEIELGEITGTTTFTTTNNAKGKHKVIHMDSNGSANTLTITEAWVWYGTKPTVTVADKKSILSLVCLGTADADVRAVFVEEA